jgi:hypothetical protein
VSQEFERVWTGQVLLRTVTCFYSDIDEGCSHSAQLGWAGLGWAGLGWAGLGWAGLDV